MAPQAVTPVRRLVAMGLFALGIPRGSDAPSAGEGQGRAWTPHGGQVGPGKGHGRASCEDT